VNGYFDGLHVGHINLLKLAKRLTQLEFDNRLIVGLKSDTLALIDRPIKINQYDRAIILLSIKYVDNVIIFNEPTPLKIIEAIKPDFLVNEIVGKDIVKKRGGEVVRIHYEKGK